jgi:polyphosphate glucokinase
VTLRPGVRTAGYKGEDGFVADAILGVDIGGSGIKGAPVDLVKGDFAADRVRVPTPQPADVKSVIKATSEVVSRFEDVRRVGVTFPGVVVNGVVRTAANMHHSWIGAPAAELFSAELGKPVVVLNDADAAGIAEVTYGVGRGRPGTLLMLTFGTGIGSALFLDGKLVPNTELGHLELGGHDAEDRASDRARSDENLGWAAWAERVEAYLKHLELLLRPDLFVIGGGVSKKSENYLPHIRIATPIVPATLLNSAGIIGAAIVADNAVEVLTPLRHSPAL